MSIAEDLLVRWRAATKVGLASKAAELWAAYEAARQLELSRDLRERAADDETFRGELFVEARRYVEDAFAAQGRTVRCSRTGSGLKIAEEGPEAPAALEVSWPSRFESTEFHHLRHQWIRALVAKFTAKTPRRANSGGSEPSKRRRRRKP